MSKRPVDAFGLSLLDVLSNALGGTLLLMMIVAASIGGNDEKRRDLPVEESKGEFLTVIDFKPLPPKVDLGLLVVQIKLWGGDYESFQLKLDGAPHLLSLSSLNRGIADPSQYLVLRKGKQLFGEWFVTIQAKSTHLRLPDSVSVFATSDDRPLCSKVTQFEKSFSIKEPILTIKEDGSLPPTIRVLNKDCN